MMIRGAMLGASESFLGDEAIKRTCFKRVSNASTSAESMDDALNSESLSRQDDSSDDDSSSNSGETSQRLRRSPVEQTMDGGENCEIPSLAMAAASFERYKTNDSFNSSNATCEPVIDNAENWEIPSRAMAAASFERYKTNDSFNSFTDAENFDVPSWSMAASSFERYKTYDSFNGSSEIADVHDVVGFLERSQSSEHQNMFERNNVPFATTITEELGRVVTADVTEETMEPDDMQEIPSAEMAHKPLDRVSTNDPFNSPVNTGVSPELAASVSIMASHLLATSMLAMSMPTMPAPGLLPMYHPYNPTMGTSTMPMPAMPSMAFSKNLQTDFNAVNVPQTQTHCGQGKCRPCFEHLRGRCMLDNSCGFCHGEEHKIRRKQKKHQRRVTKSVTVANPQLLGLQTMQEHVNGEHAPDSIELEVSCAPCEVEDAMPLFASSHCARNKQPCAPCFLHIRNKCMLGQACSYCHDPIHATNHKKKKQNRSNLRAAQSYEDRRIMS